MIRHVLAIDPASSTGWAYMTLSDTKAEEAINIITRKDNMYINLLTYGIINTNTNCIEGELCKNYKESIEILIKKYLIIKYCIR